MAQELGAPSPGEASAPAPEPVAEEARVRELGERVDGLKDKVHESKSRLLLLKEQILHDVIAEAQVVLTHRNDLSAAFTIESVVYTLDGTVLYNQSQTNGATLDEIRAFDLFSGTLVPGAHEIVLEMLLRGDGGLFSYVDGYRFRIRSSHSFIAAKSKVTQIQIVVFEQGGAVTSLEDRPSIRYDIRVDDADASGSPAGVPTPDPLRSDTP